jgi:hypothetical protein
LRVWRDHQAINLRRIKMKPSQLALADELAAIRAEIARLRSRERALVSIGHNLPMVPVFRRSPQPQVPAKTGTVAVTATHA